MKRAILLIGGNMGNRVELLHQCRMAITGSAGAIVIASSVYETKAWGKEDQPDFLNQALAIDTPLEPHELLFALQEIENNMGRQRSETYGPRLMDIDILLYEDEVIDTHDLSIPHPQMAFRRFVMVPIAEIAPLWVHPVSGKTMTEMLSACPDPLDVKKFSGA